LLFTNNYCNLIITGKWNCAGQPDLIISNVTLNPTNFIDGQVVTFSAKLENIGMGNVTRSFITRFLVDDVSLGDQYTFGLNSGSSDTVSQDWVAAPGDHKIKVVVDFINTGLTRLIVDNQPSHIEC
jgi:hypothetical protein